MQRIRLLNSWKGEGAPPDEIALSKVQAQPAAIYTCKLHVQDIAGNQSTQQAELQLGTDNQPTAAATPTASAGKLTLMVGSFAESRNAEMMVENLQWMYPDEKVQIYTAVVEGRTMHRVTVGEFAGRSEAADLKQHIQETQGVEPILITVQ